MKALSVCPPTYGIKGPEVIYFFSTSTPTAIRVRLQKPSFVRPLPVRLLLIILFLQRLLPKWRQLIIKSLILKHSHAPINLSELKLASYIFMLLWLQQSGKLARYIDPEREGIGERNAGSNAAYSIESWLIRPSQFNIDKAHPFLR